MALGRLRRDKTMIILPADKGNSTVVMDREDYDKRIDLVLSEGAYAKIPRDLTKKLEKMIRDNLQKLLRNKDNKRLTTKTGTFTFKCTIPLRSTKSA